MTHPTPARYLKSFIDYERDLQRRSPGDFKLDRMHLLLDAVGNPQDKLLAVHVAGSKGKGSTCVMLAHILQAAGYRTGLYTSPHIDSYHERIRVLGDHDPKAAGVFPDSITDGELEALLEDYREPLENLRETEAWGRLTFYEVTTALALLHFVRRGTDAVVLETGLGGRLDATNTVPARVAVITPIGLEHTAILGDTLAAIAGEKAAIIKNGQAVVLAPQQEEAAHVLERHCAERGITPRRAGPEMITSVRREGRHQVFSMHTGCGDYPDVRLGLAGAHQRLNAVCAVCAAESLAGTGLSVGADAVGKGLAAVRWPVRFEQVADSPVVIIDAAHSVESLRELKRTLADLFPGRTVHVVAGMSADKNLADMCAVLADLGTPIYLTAAQHPRAHHFNEGEAVKLFDGVRVHMGGNVDEAIDQALAAAGPQDVVLVTGSLFVAAEARRRWAGRQQNLNQTG